MAAPGTPPGMNPEEMRQMWETGSRSLLEGFRQAQEFWNNTARSLGEVAGAWTAQLPRSGAGISAEGTAALRELHEAAFAAGQAWMRLPLALATGASPTELSDAISRLTQAQGKAYKLWMEALVRAGETLRPGGGPRA
ncbi:MAG TPA: hypothetical protein VFF62_15205 [Candidatus Nitrosocosmicus sp.]|jgi:hypothetical protein|nr:hypothetical protein [Candidatus Nitrosocosmicus sp.]